MMARTNIMVFGLPLYYFTIIPVILFCCKEFLVNIFQNTLPHKRIKLNKYIKIESIESILRPTHRD